MRIHQIAIIYYKHLNCVCVCVSSLCYEATYGKTIFPLLKKGWKLVKRVIRQPKRIILYEYYADARCVLIAI